MNAVYQIHVDTINKTGGDPFQCSVYLSNTHRNVRSISLTSVQLPIGFYNVRAPYNTITINGIVYTLTPGYYSSITNFLNALNSTVTPSVGTFSYSTTTGLVTFVPSSGSATITTTFPYLWSGPTFGGVQNVSSINLASPPSLGSLMGFSNAQSGTSITATSALELNNDIYIKLYIPNLGTSSLEANMMTFKIPITNQTLGTNFIWEPVNPPTVQVTDVSAKLSKIDISVIDRWGNSMTNSGMDWSFTLDMCSST